MFCLLIERNLCRKSPSVVIGLYTESSRDFSQWFPAQELIMTSQAMGVGLWLKAVTEPNSAKPTAIAEWVSTESTGNDGNIRISDTGI